MHDEVTLQIIVCYSEYPYHHQRGHGRSLCNGVLFSEQSLMISILPMESLNVDDPLHTMRELLHYYHKRSKSHRSSCVYSYNSGDPLPTIRL